MRRNTQRGIVDQWNLADTIVSLQDAEEQILRLTRLVQDLQYQVNTLREIQIQFPQHMLEYIARRMRGERIE